MSSLSTYPFPLFFEEWDLKREDVPPYTIVGGIPARPIRKRFDDKTISRLLQIKWWDWPKERIAENMDAIKTGRIEQLK